MLRTARMVVVVPPVLPMRAWTLRTALSPRSPCAGVTSARVAAVASARVVAPCKVPVSGLSGREPTALTPWPLLPKVLQPPARTNITCEVLRAWLAAWADLVAYHRHHRDRRHHGHHLQTFTDVDKHSYLPNRTKDTLSEHVPCSPFTAW